MDNYLQPSPVKKDLWSFPSLTINLLLPFINGLMIGFGEILAHELGFHFNWLGARVYRPRSA